MVRLEKGELLLLPGETKVQESSASLQTGIRISLGRIWLTDLRIVYATNAVPFWPRKLFPLHGDLEIPLGKVTGAVRGGWLRRVFSWTPGLPTLVITTVDGETYSFQVGDIAAWISEIRKLTLADSSSEG